MEYLKDNLLTRIAGTIHFKNYKWKTNYVERIFFDSNSLLCVIIICHIFFRFSKLAIPFHYIELYPLNFRGPCTVFVVPKLLGDS